VPLAPLNFAMALHTKVAEQTYTFAEVCRLLHLPPARARALQAIGELLGPDMIVPGGGRKNQRWTASQIALIQARWSPTGGAA
jgi:hypothetical protein